MSIMSLVGKIVQEGFRIQLFRAFGADAVAEVVVGVRYENNISVLPNIPALKISRVKTEILNALKKKPVKTILIPMHYQL